MLRRLFPWFAAFAFANGEIFARASDALELWYRQPAVRWLDALPVGNGRVGGMVFGGVVDERIALNESTLWSGAPCDDHEAPGAAEAFAEIRALFRAGRYNDAAPLIPKLYGRERNYGTSLPGGELWLVMAHPDGPVAGYHRSLDLDKAVAQVAYNAGGVEFRREVIASHPSGVIAVRLTAERRHSLGFTVGYRGWRSPWVAGVCDGDTLFFEGRAVEKLHSDGRTGVRFRGAVRVLAEGGTTSNLGDSIRIEGADAATLLVALHTDFGGTNAASACAVELAAASDLGWSRLRARHMADHRALFRRVDLDLGRTVATLRPADERLEAVRRGAIDPALDALFFQYARYLMIAGSRADSPLPLHLQGLWNDGLAATMGWTCDYHLDINTEQTYWPAEVAGLGECAEPLFRLVESLQTPGRRTARSVYGVNNGWVCHVFSNPWGFTAPGWSGGWGLHVTGGAWVASHLWEHYAYDGDRDFLDRRAYPVLKGAAEFFLDYLYPDPTTGAWMTGPSVSPERGGEAGPGSVHDRAVVADLFQHVIAASEALGVDPGFRDRVKIALARLPDYKVGRNGQLREWFHMDDGGDTEHRHTSHLVGLFPFAQITPNATPELAAAASKSIDLRMNRRDWEDVEWSAGNAVCYAARLHDGSAAHKRLVSLLAGDTDTDLLTYSRGGIAGAPQNIFCIDGNMAGAAGIAEMLLQSHGGVIALLPALPPEWPSGAVHGLRARGGFTVDIQWRNGRVTNYDIRSATRRPVTVTMNGQTLSTWSRPA
jgi:alpha-L-fucosidase 2